MNLDFFRTQLEFISLILLFLRTVSWAPMIVMSVSSQVQNGTCRHPILSGPARQHITIFVCALAVLADGAPPLGIQVMPTDDEAMLFSKLLRNGLTEIIIRLCMHYPRSPPLAWSTLKRRMNTHTNLTSLPMLRVTGPEHLSYPTLKGARKLATDRKWVCTLQRSMNVAESSQENPI